MAIPIVLLYFARKRRDIPFRHLFWLFGAFIVLCGFTHFLEFYTFYSPIYRFTGLIKLFTAIASWGTVLALIPTTPKALAMRSPDELEREIDSRTSELQRTNEELARRSEEVDELNRKLRRAMAETHHRVKNNLQVVSALLDLQVMSDDAAVPKSELLRIVQHVRSLGLIHELLTDQARSDAEVEYISAREALAKILPVVKDVVDGRTIHDRADDFRVPVKFGTAIAVLVNELVSNGVKHGAGDITIELVREQADARGTARARLLVCDQGSGFPDGFDPITAANTGLDLVESLARWDLGGETRYYNGADGGACVEIRFPLDQTDVRA